MISLDFGAGGIEFTKFAITKLGRDMIAKELNTIVLEDLEGLVNDREPEGLTIEYKLELPRRERILRTICAFANSGNGDILIGAREKNHYLNGLPGVPIEEVEDIKMRVEQWVQTGLQRPVVSIRCHDVPVGDERSVVIIRVEQSWAGPHKDTDSGRFWARHSAGNREMNVDELQRAFGSTASAVASMKGFRDHRANAIQSLSIHTPMQKGPKAVLHLMPLPGILGQYHVDIRKAHDRILDLHTRHFTIGSRRFNLDGVLGTTIRSDQSQGEYAQVFRNGILELVWDLPTTHQKHPEEGVGGLVAPPEAVILPTLPKIIQFENELNVPAPIFAFLSVVDVASFKLWVERSSHFVFDYPVQHTNVLLPEVELPPDLGSAKLALRPIFDVFWQAFGHEQSALVDAQGDYLQR